MNPFIIFAVLLVLAFLILLSNFRRKKHLEGNPVPPEMEKYLTVGAIYSMVYADNARTLKSPLTKSELLRMLKRDWKIETAQEAAASIERGIAGQNDTAAFDHDLAALKESPYFQPYAESLAAFISSSETFRAENFYQTQTTLAWDLERAATLTRYAFTAGFIAEDAAWRYLKTIICRAQQSFQTWEDYVVSFLLGRELWVGNKNNASSFHYAIRDLLGRPDPKKTRSVGFWSMYPLHTIF